MRVSFHLPQAFDVAEIQEQVETEVLEREGPALPEGVQVISLPVGPENPVLQIIGSKMTGLKYDILPIVPGPVAGDDPSFSSQVIVQASSREGGQVAVIHPREPVLLHKLNRIPDGFGRIAVKTEDERSLDMDSPLMNPADGLFVFPAQVDLLADGPEDLGRDGFKTDEQADAAASGGQVQ